MMPQLPFSVTKPPAIPVEGLTAGSESNLWMSPPISMRPHPTCVFLNGIGATIGVTDLPVLWAAASLGSDSGSRLGEVTASGSTTTDPPSSDCATAARKGNDAAATTSGKTAARVAWAVIRPIRRMLP